MRRLALPPLLLLMASVVHAQAWTQEAGRAYVKVAQGFAGGDERYDVDGTVIPYNENTGGAFRDRSTYLYGELGLTDRFTAIALLPYKRIAVTDETFTPTFERRSYAWGTALVGARYDVGPSFGLAPEAPTAMAINMAIGLPLGYTRNYNPAVGPGQLDLSATLDVGRSLWPFPGYVQIGGGYRHRTGMYGLSSATACENGEDAEAHACLPDAEVQRDYGDEFLVSGEVGVSLGPVLFQTFLNGVWSVTRPEAEPLVVQPEAFVRQRYVRLGAGATVYGPAGFGVSAQIFGAAYARNALRATEVFLGVEKRF